MESPSQIDVRLLLFSVLREKAGAAQVRYRVDRGTPVSGLLDAVVVDYPALADYRPVIRFAVNEVYSGPETPLAEGDVVAFITPVSGG